MRNGMKSIQLLFRLGFNIRNIDDSYIQYATTVSVLNAAVSFSCLAIVQTLWDQGASIDIFRATNNRVLTVAIMNGDLPIVRFLIETVGLTNDDVRYVNLCQLSCIYPAKHRSVIAFLIEKGLTTEHIGQCSAHIRDYFKQLSFFCVAKKKTNVKKKLVKNHKASDVADTSAE